eukprot:gene6327-6562_t
MAQESAPVQLFGTVAVESCACRTAAPALDEEQQTHHFPIDTVLFAGGPVWAVGWCPLHGADAAAGPVETVETLAITTHPKDQRRNPTGLQHVGPGAVQLWAVPSCLDSQQIPGGQPEPIQLLRADPTPIRCVAWQPDSRWWLNGSQTAEEAKTLLSGSKSSTKGQAAGQPLNRSSNSTRHFITVSGIGAMKVWDTQDVLQPCVERVSNRHSLNSCVWLGPPHVVVTAGADGQIRQTWLDAGVQATNTPTVTADVSGSCGSIWSVSGCEAMAVVAFVADGGLLGVMPLEPPTGESRHRKSHAAVSAVAVDGDQLWLLSAREIPGNGGLYTVNPQYWKESKGKKNSTAADAPATVVLDPLPHPDQVLYAVSFSPNYRGVVMLAYGGGAGLVRVHLLSAEVVPVGA